MAGEGASPTGQRQLLVAAAVLALALSACGIQTVIYYDRPGVSMSGDTQLVIDHDSSNGSADYFQGYEIYYRVFKDSATASSVGSAIYSASYSTSTSPDYLLSQLEAGSGSFSGYPFYRMTNGTDERPLLSYASGTEYTVTIQSEQDWEYAILPASSNPLKRASATSPSYEAFDRAEDGKTWLSGDADYSGDTISGNTDLYLVAFAVGYGFDASNVETIYSMPAVFYSSSTAGYYIKFTGH